MSRFFVKQVNNEIIFSNDDLFHLKNVLRLKVGDKIELVVENGETGVYMIKNLNPVHVTFLSSLENDGENSVFIRLYYCLSKGNKVDLVIQKATELGVDEIVLVDSRFTVKKLNEKTLDTKLERFNKIALEASKQSKRTKVPRVIGPFKLDEDLFSKDTSETKIIAYENEPQEKDIVSVLKLDKSNTYSLLVGPEGGFSLEEVEIAKDAGFMSVSLGKRILRSETAAIHIVGLVSALRR